jgi:hypothetical protein
MRVTGIAVMLQLERAAYRAIRKFGSGYKRVYGDFCDAQTKVRRCTHSSRVLAGALSRVSVHECSRQLGYVKLIVSSEYKI